MTDVLINNFLDGRSACYLAYSRSAGVLYLVADNGPAVVASFNFTKKCFERTCDALVLTHDREVVDGLRALMAADRDRRPLPATVSPRL